METILNANDRRQPKKSTIEYYTPNNSPYGITYGGWTIRWWKWCFSIPRGRNPTIDPTGGLCAEGQAGPVWFLAGTWVSEERNYPHRQCCIPKGLSILFPIINCEENPIEYPNLKSKDDMRKSLSRDMATVSKYECFVDGEKLSPQIVHSDPEFFDIELRSDMSENRKGGHTTMTCSGYWVFLRPLREGYHDLSIEGSYQYGRLHSGATYDITVK